MFAAIDLSESSAVQGLEKILWKKCLAHNGSMHHSGPPWEALLGIWERLPLSAGRRWQAPWKAVLKNLRASTINN
jgi:hypothetical protein